jgi:hypothetical protein
VAEEWNIDISLAQISRTVGAGSKVQTRELIVTPVADIRSLEI